MTHREKAIAFLKQHSREKVSTFYASVKTKTSIEKVVCSLNDVCHGTLFYDQPNVIYEYATNVQARQEYGEHQVEKLVDWILGETSPWIGVTKNGFEKVYSDNNELIGVYFPDLSNVPVPWIMNISVALRYGGADGFNSILVWDDLVNFGLDPATAFFFCPYFSKTKEGLYNRRNNFNSGHWCFDHSSDIERFLNGNPHDWKENQRSTSIWSKEGLCPPVFSYEVGYDHPKNKPYHEWNRREREIQNQNKKLFEFKEIRVKAIKTRFSELSTIDLQDVVDYLKKNGMVK